MKTYSKKQLEEKAEGLFKTYSNAQKLYATSDGQFFLEENRAELHAKSKKKLSVIVIDRPVEAAQGKTDNVISVKKLKPIVQELTDKEALEKMLADEKALEDPRKTAIKLIENRIAELNTQNTGDDNSSGDDTNTGDDTGDASEDAKLLETIATNESVEALTELQEKEQATETPRQAILDAITKRLIDLNPQ